MAKHKSMQFPVEFAHAVYALILALDGIWPSDEVRTLCQTINANLGAKFEQLDRREKYTAYRTSKPGTYTREHHRQDYLDAVGIPPDWQSESETTRP